MGREVLVSGGGAVRSILLDNGQESIHMPLERAGALCISRQHVFCACGNAIVKLDRKNLMPQALFGGGPGVCSMIASEDGERLYALCAEADSVLMLSGRTGEPMLVNRAGVNPRQMALDGDVLAIAGGESGYVFLLHAHSLRLIHALSMPGPVYSVALSDGRVYALCLAPTLASFLIAQRTGCARNMLSIAGMPGCLHVCGDTLLAATEGTQYSVSLDGGKILKRESAPGRASWLKEKEGRLLLLDAYSDRLFCKGRDGWQVMCLCAAAAADSA